MADTTPRTQLVQAQNPSRTITKILLSFIYKAVTATLFLILVPVLTSRPPDFVVLPGRSWEILHIVLVGIAVSYGVFRRRKEVAGGSEEEKGGGRPNPNSVPGKLDNAQLYLNRFLQMSSLFDDEADGDSVSPSGSDVVRIQSTAWNIQYIRNEPVLIVDEDRSSGSSARISDKPLLLPVRSLRPRLSDDPRGDSAKSGNPAASFSGSGSKSSIHRVSEDAMDGSDSYGASPASLSTNSSNDGSISKRIPSGSSRRGHSGESGSLPASLSRSGANNGSISNREPRDGLNRTRSSRRVVYDFWFPESGANLKDSVVLPSPIPWQSRSGRMETRERTDTAGGAFIGDVLGESLPVMPQFSTSSSTATSLLEPVLSHPIPSSPLPKMVSPSSFLSSVSSEAKVVGAPPPPLITTTFKLPSEKLSSVSPVNMGSIEKDNWNKPSSVCRDISGIHPKSVRTIRASREEATQRKASGEHLRETFFDRVLEDEERRQEFFKKMIIESEDEETQFEDDEDPGPPKYREVLPSNGEVISDSISDGGPDVDKKAAEFIAKFREQIRLQRVESIKRLTPEIINNSSA